MSIPMPNTRIARGNLRDFIAVNDPYQNITIKTAEERTTRRRRPYLICTCTSQDEPRARPIVLKIIYPIDSDKGPKREFLDAWISRLIHWADVCPGDSPSALIDKTGLAYIMPRYEDKFNEVIELLIV